MSKRFIITEEEKNSIKQLYNISEQGPLDIALGAADEYIKQQFSKPGGPFANQTPSTNPSSTNSSNSNVSDSSLPNKTTSDDDFYKSILKCLGAEPTKSNMSFMYAWRQTEGGKAKNNPFNTTLKMPGSTKYKDSTHGVQNYKTPEDGIQAACKTLINGRDKFGYGKIIDGLKNNVGITKLSDAVVNSKWGTTDLLKKISQDYIAGISPKPKPIGQTEIA